MKKEQQQLIGLDNKVIELVKPRKIGDLLATDGQEVESLCEKNSVCIASNAGVQQDDLLF
jgi:hypothetical protein